MADVSEGTSVEATSGNLLELVDGTGKKPFLGKAFSGEKAEGTPSAAPTKVAPQDITMPPADPDAVDPLAEAEKLLAEPEVVSPEDSLEDDLEIPDEDKDKPIGRAARTIQQLRKRAQSAEGQVQQLQQTQQQFNVWAEDMTRRYRFLEERLMRPQQQQQQPQKQEEYLDPNDPQYALKKFQAEQRDAWRKDFDELRREDRTEIQKLRQQLQQREQQEKNIMTSQRYNALADHTAASMMTGFDQETTQKLNRGIGTLVLNAAYGWKTDPQSAGKALDRLMTDYVLAKLRARHSAAKTKMQTSQAAPAVPAPGRGVPNARGNPLPTRDEVKAAGEKDELALMLKRGGFRKA